MFLRINQNYTQQKVKQTRKLALCNNSGIDLLSYVDCIRNSITFCTHCVLLNNLF